MRSVRGAEGVFGPSMTRKKERRPKKEPRWVQCYCGTWTRAAVKGMCQRCYERDWRWHGPGPAKDEGSAGAANRDTNP